MGRPPAKELTERELEVMHVFWKRGEATAGDVQKSLAEAGLERAYVTIANLVRALHDKGLLKQTSNERPYHYRPVRSFEQVSRNLLRDLLERVFGGSREQMLVELLQQRKLTARERAVLERILKEHDR